MAGRQKRKRDRKRRDRRIAGPDAAPERAPSARSSPNPAASGPRAATATQQAPAPRSKDDIARESLEPLEEGERPAAVTIGALIAAALAVSNVVLYAIGIDTGDAKPNAVGTFLFAGLMGAMAVGMWRARYWAVLGFQALLALLIIVMSLLLVKAANVVAVIVAVSVITVASALFWFLVKSLARIQMPDHRQASGGS
jgi:hypothetical protein